MNISEEKSKELLTVITNINKLAHKGFRRKSMPNREFILLKTIDHLKNNDETDEYKDKGIKASELSKCLMIAKPAISKVINALEEKGYVERIADKSDRRVVYINITEAGISILDEENKRFEMFTKRVVEKMGEEDTDEMIRLFKKMYDSIIEIEKEENCIKGEE
ncbi:MAG: MarR family winged helix-turn-helix transcriptional regulator [Peptostreptococcaceae bacterium]